MAKFLGKDPATYPQERDGFIRDLQQFHEIKGSPFKRPPVLGGKEVDLYLLYSLVTAHGGWIKVNLKNNWDDILSHFRVPSNSVNGSVALKQIYLRFLDKWEKVHFLGEDGERNDDGDDESRHKRWSARALHQVPLSYNYFQHNVPENNREYNYLSTDLYKASDYDRLALSLVSPLPNEQDFAINVCTLLSNDGKHTLKLEKHPRIVDYLLGHAGVYNHGSLRKLFTHMYADVRKKPVSSFWKDVIESKDFLDLTHENKFNPILRDASILANKSVCPAPASSESPMDQDSILCDDSDSDCEIVDSLPKEMSKTRVKISLEPEDDQFFCLKRTLGTQDYVGQRVIQVATILRNLSFIEENLPTLSRNTHFIRFLLLCACSKWNVLKNLGLDMMGNLSNVLAIKDVHNDLIATNLVRLVTKGLMSEDRAHWISSLEVLNKLSQNEKNEEAMLRYLHTETYIRVCSFLTIHDVMLLIYTLECLYSLSSLGEKSCHAIAGYHGLIDTLVALVTVEGKSYGPRACIGMKLVETVTGVPNQQPQQGQQQQQQPSASASVSSSMTTLTNVSAVNTIPQVSSPVAVKVVAPSTPVRTVQMAPQRLITVTPSPSLPASNATTPVSTTVIQQQAVPPQGIAASAAATSTTTTTPASMSPAQLIQQQHAHQQAIHENEQFALAWLRATYEPAVNGKIDHQELYKHYLNSCSKIGRKGVIAPLHFPRCVRSVFGGTVGPNPMKPANATDPQFYDGIKMMAHPHLSQALLGTGSSNSTSTTTLAPTKDASGSMQGQSNTSLIKSLLANKVNECMSAASMRTSDSQNVVQVAARQHQQRMLAQQGNTSTPDPAKQQIRTETPKTSRINGARQLFNDTETGDPSVSSTTQFTSTIKGKKEPPQPPPPPLAPLSNNVKAKNNNKNEIEDSDSLSSSTGVGIVGIGGISSTEDGENSLTSFEGLLNGVPNLDNPEDSNSKDSEITMNKPLRLADLLEKKFEKSPPLLNGMISKDIRLGEKTGLDLVENHIEKALRDSDCHVKADNLKDEIPLEEALEQLDGKPSLKRAACEEIVECEAKKPLLNNVNGSSSVADSPAPDSVSSSNGEDAPVTASTAAAKLFADLAADILEDEDEEQLLQEVAAPPPIATIEAPAVHQQMVVENNPQVIMSHPRQIIVSQGGGMQSNNQVMFTSAGQLKPGQQTVIMNTGQQRNMVIQQAGGGQQFLLSSGLQGQNLQLVASPSQPGQYVIQTSGTQSYMVQQGSVVHGQPQTVLVAQTPQQQGTGAKTIIILQQQSSNSGVPQQAKMMMTQQGQQVMVTQVPRPLIHTSAVTNNLKTIKPVANVIHSGATTNGITIEEPKVPKIIRDLTTPFICEWGDCRLATRFKSANDVYMHACAAHCPNGDEEVVCVWDRCDNMKRKRFSLMTHLHDKHCNIESMKLSLIRRKKEAHGIKVDPPPPAASTSHPGYAPDAALHAIKRHALEFVNPKELQSKTAKLSTTGISSYNVHARFGQVHQEQDDNEGPVTKSIRLTASLILRNLVIYSTNCRRYLRGYESHLANVALSNVESSRTIAQILYDMNEPANLR